MTNKQIANDIIELVGGKENVNGVVHCATRLRFKLKDEAIVKTKELKNHSDVIEVVQSGGQYQVVIGSHVSEIYKEIVDITGFSGDTGNPDEKREKRGVVATFIDVVSSIFTPFLPVLAGTGVLKGLLTLLVYFGLMSDESGAYQILYAGADGFLTFLPIALAFTSAKRFQTNPFIAVALAMSLVHPGISGDLDFFGIPVYYGAGYTATVIPIIVAVYLLGFVERFLSRIMPRMLRVFGVALLSLLIMVPVTYIIIGPFGLIVGSVLGRIFVAIYHFSPVFAGIVLGGLWQVLVIFGLHWGVVPLVINNLSIQGFDPFLPLAIPASIVGQSGAALAVFFKSKNLKTKSLAASGSATAVFGITEPTVYGVNLPLKRPFVAGCIGGAIGGAINGFFGVKTFAFSASIFSIPNFISIMEGVESNVTASIVSTILAFSIGFLFTFLFGFHEKREEADDENETSKDAFINENVNEEPTPDPVIASPLTGNVVPLSDVPDAAFSSGALGKGLAVEPSVGELHAPTDGEVTTLFPTKHAVGLTTRDGIEILMHIGMNTVELEGKGFTSYVKQGDTVKKGDLLVGFDIEAIRTAGKPVVTPIIITNSNHYKEVLPSDRSHVTTGDAFLTVVRKV